MHYAQSVRNLLRASRVPYGEGVTITRGGHERTQQGRAIARSVPPAESGSVGTVLRRARMHRGLSIREVARRAQLSNTWLSQVERGVIQRPDPHALWELSSLLGLNFELLLRWSGAPQGDDNADLASAVMRAFLSLPSEDRGGVLQFLEERVAQARAQRSG
jgi:transcriptional regulator with XRE-family HTH domain